MRLTRVALIAAPVALALPVLPLVAQDIQVIPADPQTSQAEEFPWPDFLTVDPLPGRYRVTMVIENFDFPDIPGAKQNMLDDPSGEPEVGFLCVTDPAHRADMLAEISGEDCTSTEPQIDGENFRFAVTCRDPGGGVSEFRGSGSARETGLDMLLRMRMSDGETGKMTMDMQITAEREGDCE
ncbi:DUF3617 domain-containing protein [Aurantiacibacter aquimixticola]|uniref:DUF3617 family protein n=1 Tax=Aurantiacibacter aquimixticola TaxID=1958945 RepID=A0A419RQ65_9SPHN|nr:DUF3617 family protein [Aurantiacibacter aquimixticola]RJY07968.1 DUF3617 family protein [Aurantiacibacter aquimixticola]